MATSDYLLVLDGINGESKDSKYPEAIELQSFSFSASRAPVTAGSSKSEGKVELTDMDCDKLVDAASTQLFKAVAEGKKIPKAKLIGRRAGVNRSS
jgi:type VI secretion system secreted protein Hcp